MSKLVYWHTYEEPKKWVDSRGVEREDTGEWRSDHPLVESVWITGGFSPKKSDTNVYSWCNILLKDGTRKDFKSKSIIEFEEAENWLYSLEIN